MMFTDEEDDTFLVKRRNLFNIHNSTKDEEKELSLSKEIELRKRITKCVKYKKVKKSKARANTTLHARDKLPCLSNTQDLTYKLFDADVRDKRNWVSLLKCLKQNQLEGNQNKLVSNKKFKSSARRMKGRDHQFNHMSGLYKHNLEDTSPLRLRSVVGTSRQIRKL